MGTIKYRRFYLDPTRDNIISMFWLMDALIPRSLVVSVPIRSIGYASRTLIHFSH